jgi:Pyruvate/2-oxoacid:ferredoxin oxidoreductase delta subunit
MFLIPFEELQTDVHIRVLILIGVRISQSLYTASESLLKGNHHRLLQSEITPTTEDKQSVVSALTLTTTVLLQKDLQCMILCSLCTTYVPTTDNYKVLQTFKSQVLTDICTDCALSWLQVNLISILWLQVLQTCT